MAFTDVTCLRRIGDHKDLQSITFDKPKITVGRIKNNDICLDGSQGVSRYHAVFEKKDQVKWTVIDLKSSNGIWVNGEKIPANEKFTLHNKCIIEFDKSPSDTIGKYTFRFYEKATLQVVKKENPHNEIVDGIQNNSIVGKEDLSQMKVLQLSEQLSRIKEEKMKLEEEKNLNEQQLMEKMEIYLSEKLELEDEKNCLEAMYKEENKKQEDLISDMLSLKLEVESAESKFKTEMERVEDEKKKAADKVKTDMDKQLKHTLSDIQKVLKHDYDARLSQAINETSETQNKLQAELDKMKFEIDVEKKKNAAVITDVEEMLDSELNCMICAELLVRAVSLDCTHSFCELCIYRWKIENKKTQCPVCRASFNHEVRSLVLDNYIDRVVEFLGPELKQERAALIVQRSEEIKKLKDLEQKKVNARIPVTNQSASAALASYRFSNNVRSVPIYPSASSSSNHITSHNTYGNNRHSHNSSSNHPSHVNAHSSSNHPSHVNAHSSSNRSHVTANSSSNHLSNVTANNSSNQPTNVNANRFYSSRPGQFMNNFFENVFDQYRGNGSSSNYYGYGQTNSYHSGYH